MTPLELKTIEHIGELLAQHVEDLHELSDICRNALKDAYERPQERIYSTVYTETVRSIQSLAYKIRAIEEWTSILKEQK